MSVGGYPLGLTIAVESAKGSWPTGFGFDTQHLRVTARPWALNRVKLAATGGFSALVPPGSTRPAYRIAGETLRGQARFSSAAVPLALNGAADSVSVSHPNGGQQQNEVTVTNLDFDSTRPETPPASDAVSGLELSVHLLGLSAPALDGNPLGPTIAEGTLAMKIMGKLPATPDAAGLKAWRDAGGNLDVTGFALRWGPLAASATGTFALDAAMQPEGAFTVHLSGYDKAIDALAAADWLKPNAASLAKLALGVTAHPDKDNQPVVDAPLTIQNRKLSMGPVKLGTVPELQIE